jgi:hypothetical protein
MMIARFVRGLAGALALLAGFSSVPAQAQVAPVPVVRVPCCRCVDGSILRVNLNTRTAPWRVRAPGSPIFVPVVPATNVAWTNGAAPAGWVSHPNGGLPGVYIYELRIQVPRCMIRSQISLAGVFSADNGVTLSLVRPAGAPITLGVRPPPIAFQGVSNFPVPPLAANAMATPGTYILRATVINLGGPSGFVLRGQLVVRCPRDPAIGHGPAADAEADAEAQD